MDIIEIMGYYAIPLYTETFSDEWSLFETMMSIFLKRCIITPKLDYPALYSTPEPLHEIITSFLLTVQ